MDWQKEKMELESQLQKQALRFEQELDNRFKNYTALIEQLQSEIQEKVIRSRDLEEKLAQALDLAYDRDAWHEEMMQKFEMLLQMQQSDSSAISTITKTPSTPIRINPSPSSPPSKRKNTNATPHRNMYTIFQNHPGSSKSTSQGQNQNNLKHPPSAQSIESTMDVDEDQSMQPPEAESGKNEK